MTYSIWFNQGIAVLKKYGFDSLADGWDYELVNMLLGKHIDKVRAADSKEKTTEMFEAGLSAHTGMKGMRLCDFINDTQDINVIYTIFLQWRTVLLSETQTTVTVAVHSCPMDMERVL
jgi:phage terminase Nu1 subunit (DNA packaging protein)